MRLLTLALCFAASAAALAAEPVDAERAQRVVRAEGRAVGVPVSLLVAVPSGVDGRLATSHLPDAITEMEQVANRLHAGRAGSGLAQLAAAAGSAPVALDAETFTLLDEALRIARLSNGAVDPTSSPVDALWTFGPGAAPPSEAALRERTGLVNHADLQLDPATRSAKLERAGMRVDLNALVRGYALNRAVKLLESRGLRDFVLSLGGDLVVRGKKGAEPWSVGLQDPRAPGHWAALSSSSGAVMTTSDHERAYMSGDERIHDVIDPRNGRPAASMRAVTVIAGDAITADLLSRAVFVLGEDAGLALVRRVKGAEAVMITEANEVRLTPGLAKRLRYRAPTGP